MIANNIKESIIIIFKKIDDLSEYLKQNNNQGLVGIHGPKII